MVQRLDNITSGTRGPRGTGGSRGRSGSRGSPVSLLNGTPAVSGGLVLSYGSAGTYGGLDRFGRVIEQKWTNSAATTTFHQFTYACDRGGNRTCRQDVLAHAAAVNRDEAYNYDGLHRLTKANRGQVAGQTPTIADNDGPGKGPGKEDAILFQSAARRRPAEAKGGVSG